MRIEGGLLNPEIIEKIRDGEAPGQSAKDFGLKRFLEEAASAWNDARDYWRKFSRKKEELPEDDLGTTITRNLWVVPLLTLLGYNPVFVKKAEEVSGRRFPISHRADDSPEAPPVHIVGFRQDLDRRPQMRTLSPQATVQEFLNLTDYLWGVVTNGLRFRLVRASAKLTRPSYLEFDLEHIFESDDFPAFLLFFRLAHRSRLPKDLATAHECWLEKYHQESLEQGSRIRDRLRDSVEEALKILGNGFLSHPENHELREKIEKGEVEASHFYRELLQVIYRLLFIMVAEERGLIQPDKPDNPHLREIYENYYGLSRLRSLSAEPEVLNPNFHDLWEGVKRLFYLLSTRDGEKLGLTVLNGGLFHWGNFFFKDYKLSNADFLKALNHLSYFEQDGRLVRVNYAYLDVEELGSVYESLLDYAPLFKKDSGTVRFELAWGSERKSTGSYYTPPALVQELIKSALEPVLEERLKEASTRKEKERAILALKVCDPACGSGHFLLAAARRLGLELARVRTSEEHPSVDEVRHATREVIQHCLYGVDKNPLAVDLCKVALWLEGACKGEPLTFLDHRIKCGDSLVGVFYLKVLEEGIPDEAFKALEGDDKAVARELKKENKAGKKLFGPIFQIDQKLKELSRKFRELEDLPDSGIDELKAKAERYREIRKSDECRVLERACNLWTAAFFMPKTKDTRPFVPTSETLFKYLQHPKAADGRLMGQVGALAEKLRFFHWPLEFPEVFYHSSSSLHSLAGSPGFDVVLGNPPFMGGLKIRGTFGDHYHRWLKVIFDPFAGRADLCAAFYRCAFNIIRSRGRMGMVTTNSIGQGETRESGLAVILKQGGIITFAKRFVKWPGEANVEVNLVAIYNSHHSPLTTRYSPILDGRPVPFISSRLDTEPEAEPRRLSQNEGKAFQGDIVRGMGFVLEPEEAEALLAKDPRNTDCLFPYLNGENLNSHPEQKPSRWVICFHDWDLERACQYSDLLRIVEERVKPERQKLRGSGDRHSREYWWQFHNYREELRRAITLLRRVLVRSRVSELHALVFVPKGWIYNEQTIVLAFDDDYHFALLQSSVHEVWLRKQASSLRTDIRYTPKTCFDTFPFPPEEYRQMASGEWRIEDLPPPFQDAARIGAEYHEHRRQIMLKSQIGLTKTYNLFHDPNCSDADIQLLRDLHAEMDRTILACYGWNDIDPEHGFYQNERGQIRFTIAPNVCRELLRRLLELNLEIARK